MTPSPLHSAGRSLRGASSQGLPRLRGYAILLSLLLTGFGAISRPALAQGPERTLPVALPNGSTSAVPILEHRGYPAFPARALDTLGWTVADSEGDDVALRHRTGLVLRFVPGSPVFSWDGRLLQLVHEPYWFAGQLHIPLQLLIDLFPGLLPGAYRYDADRQVLGVEGAEASLPAGAGGATSAPAPSLAGPGPLAAAASPPSVASGSASRVVIIDPGHGGGDPGAMGPGGTREKDVALAIGFALARELASDPTVEVRMTREGDLEVPLWERGELATRWKGDRPGVFVSIHANALPDRPAVRGFETYFLSEARDEHERRVAAVENAPLVSGPGAGGPLAGDPLLDAILRDLRTFDHQHWSADLADQVQRQLGRFHPGPDRGVKQGPFAVITNSLMPSVLVEVGFLTNPEEERLLVRPDFHEETARALASAIRNFFERYPPGS